MISNDSSQTPAPPQSPVTPVILTIRGLGHVPSFKNMKRASSRGLFTEPRAKRWMQACTDSFALQLLSEFRTRGGATQTGLSRPSWIASSVPLDDSVREIRDERVFVQIVEPGQEGVDVVIEPIR